MPGRFGRWLVRLGNAPLACYRFCDAGGMKLQTYFDMIDPNAPTSRQSKAGGRSDESNDTTEGDPLTQSSEFSSETGMPDVEGDDIALNRQDGDGRVRDIALANATIDTSSYLPWGEVSDPQAPILVMAFLLERDLVPQNDIRIDPLTDEPEVNMIRDTSSPDNTKRHNSRSRAMADLTSSAIETSKSSLGANFKPFDPSKLETLPLGIVAHELGTLPMRKPCRTDRCRDGCCVHEHVAAYLDEDLQLVESLCRDVYVCDLSCMPYSAEANPSLTLAALAIRLSRQLSPRVEGIVPAQPTSHLAVINYTGTRVKVELPKRILAAVSQPSFIVLEPGETQSWERPPHFEQQGEVAEIVLAYRARQTQFPIGIFDPEPIVVRARCGLITPIL